jgi:hypothetical protein
LGLPVSAQSASKSGSAAAKSPPSKSACASPKALRCAGVGAASSNASAKLERRSLEVVHDEEERVFLHVDRRDDVRVWDARREARFVEGHRDELGLGGDVRVQRLDGDEMLEASRTQRARGAPSPSLRRRSVSGSRADRAACEPEAP